jgi:TPR repeat protein
MQITRFIFALLPSLLFSTLLIAEDFKETLRKAEQGDVAAQTTLGECYINGEGISQNFSQGFFWFQKAALAGDPNAQSELGNCYTKGFGVDKNEQLGVYWRTKAAKQGNGYAQYNLGINLMYGEGVAKDEIEAYAFLNLASASSRVSVSKRAKSALASLETTISRAEIADGQKRTKELLNEIEANKTPRPALNTSRREDELIELYTHAYGCSSKLSLSDLRQIARFEKLQADWNAALAPLVKGLRDPNIMPEDWARTAHLYLNEVEKIKVRMTISAAQVEESKAKATLSQISDLNNQIFNAWVEIRQAVSSGDSDAYRRAGVRSQSLAQEKANVAGPILRRLRDKLGDKAVEGALEREMRNLADKVGM